MRRVILVLVAGALLLCWAVLLEVRGLGGPSLRYTVSDLQRQPESRLLAPDTTILADQGYSGGGLYHAPARAEYKLGTTLTVDAVEEFYRRALGQRGWTGYSEADFVSTIIRYDNTWRYLQWRKGDLDFQLAILRPGTRFTSLTPQPYVTYNTYYAISVSEIVGR